MAKVIEKNNKDDLIRVRVKSSLKKEAGAVLNKLGMNYSEAFSLFLSQVTLRRGLPFDVKTPNQTTLDTFTKTDRGEDLTYYENKDALFDDLRNL